MPQHDAGTRPVRDHAAGWWRDKPALDRSPPRVLKRYVDDLSVRRRHCNSVSDLATGVGKTG